MPHKLKTSARRSRRNKRIGIVASVIVLVAVVAVVAFYAFGQSPASKLVVQGKVLLQTSMGNITIQLRDDKPITAANFKSLVEQGAYDNTTFHRVIAGFMIQGGQVNRTVNPINDEIGTNNHNVNGTIAMAKTSAPNSATSQFFINVVDNSNRYPEFDTTYTVFGNVIAGMNVAEDISKVATDSNDKPIMDVVLIKAEILP